ncbi:unnamed protein product [Peronospora belbahrii]|nr:unnamed protein product [Peronospora belbahrii]
MPGETIAVASVFVLLFALCFGWILVRSFKNFQHEAELNVPLIESKDRRLDAAIRDAEEGFHVCAFCGFENFKRFRFCTVCGEWIVERKDSDEEQNDGHAKGKTHAIKVSLLLIFRRISRVDETLSAPVARSSTLTTRRRLRALRRKEWRRKLDVEGRAYWFRDSRFGKAHVISTAFVVAFELVGTRPIVLCKSVGSQTQPSVRVIHTSDNDHSLPSSSSNHTEVPTGTVSPVVSISTQNVADAPRSPRAAELIFEQEHSVGNTNHTIGCARTGATLGPVERRMENLERFVQEKRPVLLFVSDTRVDASKLSIGVHSFSSDTAQDAPGAVASASVIASMTDAAKDFPSKYAHFVMKAAKLLVPAEKEHLRLNIVRASVFSDSMECLAVIPLRNLHSPIRINFLDEHGVDAGGLQREWFVMLNEALLNPHHGLFVCTDKSEQTYYLNPCPNADILPRQLLYLLAAGRLLGRALLERSMVCFHLAPPLLKLMLGYPLCFSDLEDVDPVVYNNLRWLLANDDADMLGLDFTVSIKDGDRYHDVELVPGGKDIAVTDSNKIEYVERRWQYVLIESVSPQLQIFLRGLYEIIPRNLLLLFDPVEFDFLLCGSEEIDVEDWKCNTTHSGVSRHHRVFKWFWGLVHEMPNEYRRRLLQFATGSLRVPLSGFSALTSYDGRLCPFTLNAVAGDGFIHSHACFNCLDLPLHAARDEFKAMLYAILETEAYGFTMA